MNACSSPSVQGPGFLPATACGASIHVPLPEVKAIFLAKGSGERPDAAPARKRDFGRPDLVVGLRLVSAPALSFSRETVVAFGAYRAVPGPADLRQAVAFREHTEPPCGPGEAAVAALGARPPQGRQGLGDELGVFLLVPSMLLTWDFLETVS